jgi:hypothetical protein
VRHLERDEARLRLLLALGDATLHLGVAAGDVGDVGLDAVKLFNHCVEVVVERLADGGAVTAWMVEGKRLNVLGHGSSESDTKLLGSLVESEENGGSRTGEELRGEKSRVDGARTEE